MVRINFVMRLGSVEHLIPVVHMVVVVSFVLNHDAAEKAYPCKV